MVLDVTINYWAVLVAAIAGMAIGALWYSPMVFGKAWMTMNKLTMKDMEEAKKRGMTKVYILAFVGHLVMAYVLAHFIGYVESTTVVLGLQLAFWLWLGFIATVFLNTVLWEGKPVKLYLLNVLHYLVVIGVMSSILAAWH